LRDLRLFFLSPSAPAAAAGLATFFDALDSVVLAGALEAVEAGALPAVEAGLGAITSEFEVRLVRVDDKGERGGGRRERYGWSWTVRYDGIYTAAQLK
jgi:hypothetical protein